MLTVVLRLLSLVRVEWWRDVDHPEPRFGVVLRRRGVDVAVGRRLYRARTVSRG